MSKRHLTIGGTLTVAVLAFTAGCKTTAPASDDAATPSEAAAAVEAVDLSNVTSLDLHATASAEMGGPAKYTLALITSADDLPAAVAEQGLDVDFEVHDVILVAMGEQPSSGYGATITGAQQVGSTVYVQASFEHPAPDSAVAQVVTSPWAAATIYKRKAGVTLLSDFD